MIGTAGAGAGVGLGAGGLGAGFGAGLGVGLLCLLPPGLNCSFIFLLASLRIFETENKNRIIIWKIIGGIEHRFLSQFKVSGSKDKARKELDL